MISSVHVQEASAVEHDCISELRRQEVDHEELVEPKTFSYKQQHSSVEYATFSE